MHKEEESWHILRDIHLGVGDPWILQLEAIPKGSAYYTWRNKQIQKPMWQRIDRFYVPLGWINRVSRVEILSRAVRSDHYPIRMDIGLSDQMQKESRSPGLFRANMAVAMSEAGKTGVKEILKSWNEKITNISPLERLEKALTECREFLRNLGADLAKERRRREMGLRAKLEAMLLRVPESSEEEAKELMRKIEETSQKISSIEANAAKSHQIKAGLKWELEGDRPTSFFFSKARERKAKRYIEGLYSTNKKLETAQEGLENVIVDSFTELFHSKGPTEEWKKRWEEVLPKIKEKVSAMQRAILDRELTEKLIQRGKQRYRPPLVHRGRKAMHAQWLIRCLSPGAEPWKAMLRLDWRR